jgi:hypothetical protein
MQKEMLLLLLEMKLMLKVKVLLLQAMPLMPKVIVL